MVHCFTNEKSHSSLQHAAYGATHRIAKQAAGEAMKASTALHIANEAKAAADARKRAVAARLATQAANGVFQV
jgi:hypothetical protein